MNNQAKLLVDLAKKIKAVPKKRAAVVGSLTSAGILTKKENLTTNYSNLKKKINGAD